MHANTPQPVFEYHTLRLLVGLIALTLPFTVTQQSGIELSSISGSYHTVARNLFVGQLCIVGAFLWAYNGHSWQQSLLSSIAAIGAIGVALYPTSCATDASLMDVLVDVIPYCAQFEATETPHFISAAVLFGVLALFCFMPFQQGTKHGSVKQRRRSKIYYGCGVTMVVAMLVILIANYKLSPTELDASRIVYWGEAFALVAFGIAWIVSGKFFSLLTDEFEKNRLLGERQSPQPREPEQ